jgi:uncharacterized membrane protein YGL010W
MGALCFGFKAPGLAVFGLGVFLIERDWRVRHPDFHGGIGERWQSALEFYRQTHQHPTNRTLHIVGIPLIVAGAAGLFASSPVQPVWVGSLSAFGVGWVLNIIGHAGYEKRAPAFSEDGLSFLAGPVWDLQALFSSRANHRS